MYKTFMMIGERLARRELLTQKHGAQVPQRSSRARPVGRHEEKR